MAKEEHGKEEVDKDSRIYDLREAYTSYLLLNINAYGPFQASGDQKQILKVLTM